MFRSCALSLQKTTHACDPTTLASTHAHPCIRPAHTRICARASSETNASPPVALHPRAYAPGWLVCAQHFMCALPLSPWPHATFPVHTQARFCALHGKVLHQHAALVDPTKSGGESQTTIGTALPMRRILRQPFSSHAPASCCLPSPPIGVLSRSLVPLFSAGHVRIGRHFCTCLHYAVDSVCLTRTAWLVRAQHGLFPVARSTRAYDARSRR